MSTSNKKYILAIDLGTSGPKVALVSTGGDVVDHEFQETPILLFPNGGAEQRPDDWWNAIIKASKRVLGKGLVPLDDVVAVCCTSQWSGTVAVDRAGAPLMNAIIWMDSRGAPHVKRISGGRVEIEGYGPLKLLTWLRLTGGIPAHSGKDSIAHILYIKHESPEIYRQTYKFLEPKDYINLRLTGKFAASFDSIALHWVTDNRDLSNVVYNDKLIRWSEIERDKLPDLKRAVDVLGPIEPGVAHELGLNENVQVVMGTPDIHSALIGSGAVRDYEGHLYVGTSSWLTCHVPFKKTDIFHNMTTLPAAIPEKYFITNEQESAGACLNFLCDKILYHQDELPMGAKPPDVYKIFDKIVEKIPPGSDKLIFTPWIYGERTPIEDHLIRGGFHNMSLQTTREHLVRAVFEGVAYNIKWLFEYVEKLAGQRMDPINMVGGGANSDVWCQIYADVLDRTIRQVQDPIQANARGAGFLASVALGYLTFDEIPERIHIANTYTPNPANRAIYDQLFKEFRNLYKHNRKIHARLNSS